MRASRLLGYAGPSCPPGTAPTALPIPAWSNAPGTGARYAKGLKARPISAWSIAPRRHMTSIPQIPLVKFHSIFPEERPQLILKRRLAMMRLLVIDVLDQSIQIRRSYRKRPITTLPRELRQLRRLGLEPFGRGCFKSFYQLRQIRRPRQTNREMHMVRYSANAITFAFQIAGNGSQICIKRRPYRTIENRFPIFCTENDVNQNKRERLRHRVDYSSGLQPPCPVGSIRTWGFTPGWYRTAPSALSQRALEMHTTPLRITTTPPKSAKGATPYQPGAEPQVANQTNNQGLKARPIQSEARSTSTLQEMVRRPQKDPLLETAEDE
jgi:hypothetical protein